MTKATWADIKKGDRVELAGKTWDVLRAKAKGKKVEVTITSGSRKASSVVRAADKVKKLKPAPLHDKTGAQTRWATKKEVTKTLGKLEPGDPSATKPPAKPSADVWETPRDRIEAKLDDLLSARLVAESPDTALGYYVPPVDVSTVAAHLATFHGLRPSDFTDEGAMLTVHRQAHNAAYVGEGELAVNHWHTKTRPVSS